MTTTRCCARAQAGLGLASGHLASKRSALNSQHLPTSDPLVGLAVVLADRCRCGGNLARVDPSALHQAALSCRGCGRHRGFLERNTANFVTEIIKQFGPLTQPIVLRRSPEIVAARRGDDLRDGPPTVRTPVNGGTEE
jgi:hypothetical protein